MLPQRHQIAAASWQLPLNSMHPHTSISGNMWGVVGVCAHLADHVHLLLDLRCPAAAVLQPLLCAHLQGGGASMCCGTLVKSRQRCSAGGGVYSVDGACMPPALSLSTVLGLTAPASVHTTPLSPCMCPSPHTFA